MKPDPEDFDLAILHVVDTGDGNIVRLTHKADAGMVGHKLVFDFDSPEGMENFIQQLRSVRAYAFPDYSEPLP